ncbi:MAG: hypothetical protein KUG77_21125, partial [Nannocystaceae bacterium]|nr:hypothetical protein [Nannocystaceae bacterium]
MPRRFGQTLISDDASEAGGPSGLASGPRAHSQQGSQRTEPGTFGSGLPGLGKSVAAPPEPRQPDAQTGFVGNSGFGGGVSAGLGGPDLSQDPGQDSLAPSLDLPKGGGALRGIGETFDVNTFTGSGSLSIPVVSSPSRGAVSYTHL